MIVLVYDIQFLISRAIELLILEKYPNSTVIIAKNDEELIEYSKAVSFDLIVLDIYFNETENIGLLKRLRWILPSAKILLLTSNKSEFFISQCFSMGANAILNKIAKAGSIEKAINLLLIEDSYDIYDFENNQKKVDLKFTKNNNSRPLSTREFQLAKMLVKGDSTTNIALKLSIAKSTVSTFKKRIFEKTNTRNIIQLAEIFKNKSLKNKVFYINRNNF